MSITPRSPFGISKALGAAPLAWMASPLIALIPLVAPAQAAGTNLIKNGDFEINGGPNYVFNTSIANWTMSNTPTTSVPIQAINTYAQLQAGGAPVNIPLWGVSPTYVNGNGFTDSPNGGYFLISDGYKDYNAKFSQTVTGLTVGNVYELAFEYAFGQQGGFDGATTQRWTGSFGSDAFATPLVNPASHGFEAWQTATYQFTATSTSQTLQFLSEGTPGLPPMALLDGVTMFDVTPPADAPGPLPLLGLGASLAWSRRLRQRLKQGDVA